MRKVLEPPINGIGSPAPVSNAELSRFSSVLKRLARAQGEQRRHFRKVLISYLSYSTNANDLIDTLIQDCLVLKSSESFDIAIDVLSQLGEQLQNYAFRYIQQDMMQFNRLYPERKYVPNEDYWYVLLRSIGKCDGPTEHSLSILSVCQDDAPRAVSEAVVEGLADLDTTASKSLLASIGSSHKDSFIKALASDLLAESK